MSTRPGTIAITGRLSFPKLWKKEASAAGAEPKYSLSIILDPNIKVCADSIERVNDTIKLVAENTWKAKADKIIASLGDRTVMFDGDDLTNSEGDEIAGYPGNFIVRAGNRKEFKRLARDKTPLTEEICSKQDIMQGGQWVDAVISVYPITDKDKGGNGIFATIEVVRYRKDGERFGAAPVNEDDFLDDLDDDEDEDDVDSMI